MLLDIDGVLTVSWRALPGAVAAMARLRQTGLGIRLVTNTTSRTRAWMATRLSAQGFPVHPEDILTAPGITARYLQEHHPGARCMVVNDGDLTRDLPGVTLVSGLRDDVDVVVLGGAGPCFDYASMNRIFRHLQRGAALVAMNRNHYWATEDGLRLDTGTFLDGLEQASGVTAVATGKPAPLFFTAALAHLGAEPGHTLMVGDDVTSDVVAAQEVGIRGVLVRTGKYLPRDHETASLPPNHILNSFSDLPDLIEELNG